MNRDEASAADLRIREAARALVMAPDGRVLLVRFDFPARTVWATPGGGIDPGETHEDALRRELLEEVGLADPEIGPALWDRLHVFPFINGQFDGQHERCYLVRVADVFEPTPAFSWEQLNAEYLMELRWWTLDDLRAADVITAPRALVELLTMLRDGGPPADPWQVDEEA
ncbi:MAG: putative hydrolase [Ilumatobacteraceae bacterium]|nr:putative hydrolase [Ilumatobacteraceae bacterium]